MRSRRKRSPRGDLLDRGECNAGESSGAGLGVERHAGMIYWERSLSPSGELFSSRGRRRYGIWTLAPTNPRGLIWGDGIAVDEATASANWKARNLCASRGRRISRRTSASAGSMSPLPTGRCSCRAVFSSPFARRQRGREPSPSRWIRWAAFRDMGLGWDAAIEAVTSQAAQPSSHLSDGP
jgi:hypothetical protein